MAAPQQDVTFKYDPDAVDWVAAADQSTKALIEYFWNPRRQYLNARTNLNHYNNNYWPQAHGMDVFVDAYLRTGDDFYKRHMDEWSVGVRRANGNTWANNYIDDMEWIGISALRAYRATGDEKFHQICKEVWDGTTDQRPYTTEAPTNARNNGYYGIKRAWMDDDLGGICWKSDRTDTRNACSNAPASIVGSLLYQEFKNEDDLNWAKKIYDWQREKLFKPETGNVSDSIRWSNYPTNTATREGTFTLTYNQGTFVGSAVELYKITGEKRYITDAMAAADQVLKTKCTDNVISSERGSDGDGAMFKGIFIRWFTQLILCDGLDESVRKHYISWLINNGGSLWHVGRNDQNLLSGNWRAAPPDVIGFQSQISGCMLFEALAMLKTKGYF